MAVRPSEMNALNELPNIDKKLMLPLIMIGPWVGSIKLQNTMDKIISVYPNLPWIADINPDYPPDDPNNRRDVHGEIDNLCVSDNGFRNWCAYVREIPQAIPCLQIGPNADSLELNQVTYLLGLDRGLVLRIRRQHFGAINILLETMVGIPPEQLLIVLDYGQIRNNLLNAAECLEHVNSVTARLGNVSIVVAGTSFPYTFDGLPQQEIVERNFFNVVQADTEDVSLIYGDYGSARAERLAGGGGVVFPRIDYPLNRMWIFERQELLNGEERSDGYRRAAHETIHRNNWDGELKIWGTQMIESTALGDPHAITSPARATSARINIHLHRQTLYDAPAGAIYETEDDWED